MSIIDEEESKDMPLLKKISSTPKFSKKSSVISSYSYDSFIKQNGSSWLLRNFYVVFFQVIKNYCQITFEYLKSLKNIYDLLSEYSIRVIQILKFSYFNNNNTIVECLCSIDIGT